MNKFLIGILFCLSSLSTQADSIVVPIPLEKAVTHKTIVDEDSPITLKKFQPNFKTNYQQQPDFNYAAPVNEGFYGRLKDRVLRWVDEYFSFKVGDKPAKIWDKALNYISVILLFGLTFFVVRAIIRKDALWFFKKSKRDFAVNYTDEEKNLEQIDFQVLIGRALENDQHRLAIRYYYLWLLKVLSKKEIIQWDLEKTNSDYLAEIKNEETRKSFQYLSYLYNNIWYGEFDVDLPAFKKAAQAFNDFLKPWRDE